MNLAVASLCSFALQFIERRRLDGGTAPMREFASAIGKPIGGLFMTPVMGAAACPFQTRS